MVPKISVRRKGDDIFLTVEGNYDGESLKELLSVARKLFKISLKCAASDSQVTYSIKTQGKVNLDGMHHVPKVSSAQPHGLDEYGDSEERQQREVVKLQGESPLRENRRSLTLVKGETLLGLARQPWPPD